MLVSLACCAVRFFFRVLYISSLHASGSLTQQQPPVFQWFFFYLLILSYSPLVLTSVTFLLTVDECVQTINNLLESGTADELMVWLQKPESLLPAVDPNRPHLYFDNLTRSRLDKGQVLHIVFY